MKVVRQPDQVVSPSGATVALVPTMGAFHDGHLELMRKAKQEADWVVVSLFVNPTQFGPTEDLAKYPRNEAKDAELASSVGVDLLFAPTVDTMYPRRTTTVHVEGVSDLWEGASRPGHFDGVATVVCKLFHIVQPQKAFFGLKDFQQCAVIRRMVEDLDMPVALRFIETVREPDGLALSSRNRYLLSNDRKGAALMYKVLVSIRQALTDNPARAPVVLQEARSTLSAGGFLVDYLALVNGESLLPIEEAIPGARLIVAARYGGVRLIDNIGF